MRLRDDKNRRHLIIVGEPGSGKSHFIAHLARLWNCPHHFIRMDSIGGGVTGIDTHNFLLSIGQQLYQKYGSAIFDNNMVEKVKVDVDITKDQAEVIGQFIEELYTLPFLPISYNEIEVHVGTAIDRSRTVGQHIKRLYDTTYSLPVSTLLHATIISPLKKLQELDPDERVVILIDALDESLSQINPNQIIDSIPHATEPDYPANLRLVITSRRGSHLDGFLTDDFLYLDEKDDDHKKKGYQYRQKNLKDARDYIHARLTNGPLSKLLISYPPDEIAQFISTVERNGDGNFLYLYHFFNEVERIVPINNISLQDIIVPKGLNGIYRVFAINKIKKSAMDFMHFAVEGTITHAWVIKWQEIKGVQHVKINGQNVSLEVKDINEVLGPFLALTTTATDIRFNHSTLKIEQGKGSNTWEENYLPLLGILSIIQEPVSQEELAGFSKVPINYVNSFIEQILQFLEVIEDVQTNRYRVYHSSFREYLLDKTRNRDFDLDALEFHRRIVAFYRHNHASWDEVNWSEVKSFYAFHHLAFHLVALKQFEELYSLMSVGKNQLKWFEAHFRAEASYVGYLRDLDFLWSWITEKDGWNLNRQMRYVLISSSVHSLVGNTPPQLMPNLIQSGRIAPGTALAYIKRIPNLYQQAKTLKLVVPFLVSPELLQEALRIATTIADNPSVNEQERLNTLCTVIQHLPSELQTSPIQLLWDRLQETIDLEYILEKIAPFWGKMPEVAQKYVIQKLQGFEHETSLVNALVKLFPFFSLEQKSNALTLMQKISDKHLRIVSQAKIIQYTTDKQKQDIQLYILKQNMDIYTYIKAPKELLPLLSERQRTLMVEHMWTILQEMVGNHYEAVITQLGLLVEFMTESQKKEAVALILNVAPFTSPHNLLKYNLLKTKAISQLVAYLPETHHEQMQKYAHSFAQKAIDNTEKDAIHLKKNLSMLLKFLQYFSEQQQRQALKLADSITNQYERAFTLLQIIDLDLLQHLFPTLQDEFIVTIEILTQKINDQRELLTVLIVLAKYASASVSAEISQDIVCLIEQILEEQTLDQQNQALVWLSLVAYLPDQKQAETVNKAIGLMRPHLTLDHIAGKLIDHLPNMLLHQLLFPPDIQIHLNEKLIRGKKKTKNLSKDLVRRKKASYEQQIEAIYAILEALKNGEYSNKDIETILATISNFSERIAFFDDDKHVQVWRDTLQTLATRQRKDCLQSLVVFLPLFLHLSAKFAEGREADSVVYDLLQTIHDVERWWH